MNKGGKNLLALSALAIALAACGGGGDDAGVLPEGVYGGKLTGSSYQDFQMLVLENGELWVAYGTSTPSAFSVAGFVQGNTNATSTSFSSGDARDYGVAPAATGTATGTFSATAKTVSGSVTANGRSVSFSGGPIAGSLYDYSKPAKVADVSGNWTLGTTLINDPVSLNVLSNGTLSATSQSGCSFNGTIAPRASGKNILNVSVTFGPSPCALPGQTASGIAFYYPLSSGSTQLAVALQNAGRTNGIAAFGTRSAMAQ